jgi:hypothetical protein
MTITGQDAYGTYLDTGCNTAPTLRPSTEVEVHVATEVDSGTTLAPASLPSKHIPHRAVNSPR